MKLLSLFGFSDFFILFRSEDSLRLFFVVVGEPALLFAAGEPALLFAAGECTLLLSVPLVSLSCGLFREVSLTWSLRCLVDFELSYSGSANAEESVDLINSSVGGSAVSCHKFLNSKLPR